MQSILEMNEMILGAVGDENVIKEQEDEMFETHLVRNFYGDLLVLGNFIVILDFIS